MIKISKEILMRIVVHCKKESPREACGILSGARGRVEQLYTMKNVSETPANCYFMEPKEQLKVFKEIREGNLEMLSIYHSHYGVKAYPSSKDIELAFYPDCEYLIISLDCPGQEKGEGLPLEDGRVVIRSFSIIDGKITERKIDVIK